MTESSDQIPDRGPDGSSRPDGCGRSGASFTPGDPVSDAAPPDVATPQDAPPEALPDFRCGQCGATLEYQPGSHSQTCPYCGHENPIAPSEQTIHEQDFRTMLASLAEGEETAERLTVTCDGCGAEVTTEPNITSQTCPFCGSAIVATARSARQIKPRALLPFKIDRKQAWARFQEWIAGLWFAPNDLKKRALRQEQLVGMYVPYWTYDSKTTTRYTGWRGEHYWVTEHYTTMQNGKPVHRTRQVRKTRWWPASGTVYHAFDDVLVLASRSLPRRITEKLEPWDLGNLTPYQDAYLSGFRAESYQIDLAEGFEYAVQIMDGQIRRLVRRDIGGDEQRISSVSTRHDDVTFKHVLLPVWISAYRYGDKVYRFLINGRTGEVQGQRPWSVWKIVLVVLGAVIVAGLVALAVAAFQG